MSKIKEAKLNNLTKEEMDKYFSGLQDVKADQIKFINEALPNNTINIYQ